MKSNESEKYILKYGYQPVVVKASGKVLDKTANDKPFNYFLDDIAKCHAQKLKIAVVHGGGVEINNVLTANGISIKFAADGSRITDMKTLPYVIESMAEVNQSIVEGLKSRDVNVESVLGTHLFDVEPKDFDTLGYVGKLAGFNTTLADKFRFKALSPEQAYFKDASIVPVVNPICNDKYGRVFNVNADDVATEIAVARKARLIMMSDTAVKDKSGILIPQIDIASAEFQELISSGVLKDGMLKKIFEGASAIERGMKPMSIIDGTIKNALWDELTTDTGSGTMVFMGVGNG